VIAGQIPSEVFVPILESGIEQSHHVSRFRVKRRDPAAFMIVAKGTCQPEIFFLGRSAQGQGDDVIYFHWRADDMFRNQAVSTAEMCLLRNALA